MQKSPITTKGIKRLEEERNKLKNVDRPTIIQAISAARELGDLSENAEYHAAREQQGFIEGRIKELDSIIASAEPIDPTTIQSEKILFGATIQIQDITTDEIKNYQIVGEKEADINLNLLSNTSLLGKSLIGKVVGDIVEIKTPKSLKQWEILSIKYI